MVSFYADIYVLKIMQLDCLFMSKSRWYIFHGKVKGINEKNIHKIVIKTRKSLVECCKLKTSLL